MSKRTPPTTIMAKVLNRLVRTLESTSPRMKSPVCTRARNRTRPCFFTVTGISRTFSFGSSVTFWTLPWGNVRPLLARVRVARIG